MKGRLVLSACALIFSSVLANAEEAPPLPAIMESFLCNWQPGKDMDDLMAARDNFVKGSEKGGYETPTAYVWNQYRGTVPVQLIWHSVYPNMANWAEVSDAGVGNEALASAMRRFNSVANCNAVLGTVRTLFSREVEAQDGTFVVSRACNVNDGFTPEDMQDYEGHVAGYFGSLGDKAPIATYVNQPITAGPDSPDGYVFSVFKSASHWNTFVNELYTTDAGAQYRRHDTAKLECALSIWSSQMVVNNEG